jgi:hypothetical protein
VKRAADYRGDKADDAKAHHAADQVLDGRCRRLPETGCGWETGLL